MKSAFKQDGSVTAGNSGSLNDGAAAVLLVSDLQPLARIRIMTTAGVPPRVMGIGPVPAPRKALERAGISPDDLGLVELNEAFAAQVLAVLHEWKMAPTDERLNPNGGAIALGHPLGCSGWSSRRWPDGRRPVGAVEAGHAVGDGELLRVMRPRPGPARRCRPSPAALGVARRSCRALGAPAWVLSDANGVGWVTTQPNGQPAVREARGCDVDGRIDARSGSGLDYPVSQMAR
jgi:hypothetical protein